MAVWQSYLGVISFCSNKGIWSLSYLEGKGMFCLLCWKHDAGSKFNGRFHIRGRTNHLDRQSSGICPSDLNLCRTVVYLFVSTNKSSGKNRLSRRPNIRRFVRPIFTWDDLFIWDDLAVQTICSSSSVKTANKSKVFNLDGSVRFRKMTLIELSNSQQHRDAISAEHLQRVSAFHREINEKENTAHDVSFKAFYSLYWLAKEEIPNRKFTSLLSLLEHLGLEEMKY